LLVLLKPDKSTDMSGPAVLLAFVHYLFENKTVADLLSNCAAVKLLLFHTSFLCKAGFFKVCGNNLNDVTYWASYPT